RVNHGRSRHSLGCHCFMGCDCAVCLGAVGRGSVRMATIRTIGLLAALIGASIPANAEETVRQNNAMIDVNAIAGLASGFSVFGAECAWHPAGKLAFGLKHVQG